MSQGDPAGTTCILRGHQGVGQPGCLCHWARQSPTLHSSQAGPWWVVGASKDQLRRLPSGPGVGSWGITQPLNDGKVITGKHSHMPYGWWEVLVVLVVVGIWASDHPSPTQGMGQGQRDAMAWPNELQCLKCFAPMSQLMSACSGSG